MEMLRLAIVVRAILTRQLVFFAVFSGKVENKITQDFKKLLTCAFVVVWWILLNAQTKQSQYLNVGYLYARFLSRQVYFFVR